MQYNYVKKLINTFTQNKEFYKQYFTYSLPALITIVISSALDMTEAILLGKAQSIYIAVLNVTSPFFMMASLIFAAFPTAAIAIISKYYGEKDIERARKTAGLFIYISNIFLLCLIIVIILNLEVIICVLVNKRELQQYAKEYLKVKFIGLIFFCNNNLIAAIFKSFLEFYKPFYITVSAIILNFVLDIILIFGYFGLPALGITGAAYGYAISFFLASIIMYLVLFSDKQSKPLFHNIFSFFKEIWKKLYPILFPALSEPIFIQSGYIVFNALINRLDVAQITAHRIAIYIESITFIPGFTLSQVIQPISGYYFGKKDEIGLRKTVRLVEILVLLLMLTMGSTFLLFPFIYANIFTNNKEIFHYTTTCIQFAFFEQPFLALAFVYLNFMRGLGLNSQTLVVSILGVWGIRLPLTYLCIFVGGADIRYIWLITIIDWLIRSTLFIYLYNRKSFYKKLLMD